MKFKNKEIKVIIAGDAKTEYEHLNKIVLQELEKGINSSTHQTLLHSLEQKIDLLKENPESGIHIQKDKIPKIYVHKYDVNNLWKINLSGAWRLIYTIKGSEVEIISLLLDILPHKDYDKIFGYRKR